MTKSTSGVDLIKLDFLTPGSPFPGDPLPEDSSRSVEFYRHAISRHAPHIRLDISWKLDRNEPYWTRWQNNADSLRLDFDVNLQGANRLTAWRVIQRAIEAYRVFVVEQITDPARRGHGIRIRPDMDNTFIVNPQELSGINDDQRRTMAVHWIGAGANLMTGGDLLHIDELGRKLLGDVGLTGVADMTSQWPMQPRNPDSGGNAARQLQAWIAGPTDDLDGTREAVVLITNLGPDEGEGGFGSRIHGFQRVRVTLNVLGLDVLASKGRWTAQLILGTSDHTNETVFHLTDDGFNEIVGPGQSMLYRLWWQPNPETKMWRWF